MGAALLCSLALVYRNTTLHTLIRFLEKEKPCQYIALLGLSRSDFFYKSAFYGGTALRMFYNLDRFSDDLDFSLLNPDRKFSLDPYISFVQNELDSYGFHTEVSVRVCDGPTLFAGKLSALLTRGWHQRVKGRDWFDMVFLINRNIPVSLSHLESRLRQAGFYTKVSHLSETELRELLEKRIQDVDIELAKKDVIRFIRNPKDVDVWSKDYFRYVAGKLRVQ